MQDTINPPSRGYIRLEAGKAGKNPCTRTMQRNDDSDMQRAYQERTVFSNL